MTAPHVSFDVPFHNSSFPDNKIADYEDKCKVESLIKLLLSAREIHHGLAPYSHIDVKPDRGCRMQIQKSAVQTDSK